MYKLYNIYVFTASIELYAKPLLEKLDKNNLIKKKNNIIIFNIR